MPGVACYISRHVAGFPYICGCVTPPDERRFASRGESKDFSLSPVGMAGDPSAASGHRVFPAYAEGLDFEADLACPMKSNIQFCEGVTLTFLVRGVLRAPSALWVSSRVPSAVFPTVTRGDVARAGRSAFDEGCAAEVRPGGVR